LNKLEANRALNRARGLKNTVHRETARYGRETGQYPKGFDPLKLPEVGGLPQKLPQGLPQRNLLSGHWSNPYWYYGGIAGASAWPAQKIYNTMTTFLKNRKPPVGNIVQETPAAEKSAGFHPLPALSPAKKELPGLFGLRTGLGVKTILNKAGVK
jgi:hypothetical protein